MAGYDSGKLDLIDNVVGGQQNEWWYRTTDAIATVRGAGYFSDGVKRGMKLGDSVRVFKTDGPNIYQEKVSAVDTPSVAGLYTATVLPSDADAGLSPTFANIIATGTLAVTGATTLTGDLGAVNVNASGNVALGDAASDTIGLYGATKVSQRASAVQASSNISASTFATIGSNLAAFLAEVANTLQGLGAWKGAA